jgi:hypothetical protein
MAEVIKTNPFADRLMASFDLANTITNIMNISQDLSQSQTISDRVKALIKTNLIKQANLLIAQCKANIPSVVGSAKESLPTYLSNLNEQLLEQSRQAGLGFRMTSTMLGQEGKVIAAMNSIDMLSEIVLSMPESVLKTKIQRYYLKLLAPNFPSERDAYMMTINKYWSDSDFIELLQETQGLTKSDAEAVAKIRKQTIGKPALHDAWSMVQHGLKPLQYFLDLAVLGQGWTKEDADTLNKLYDYDFSPSEIMRMSDFVPLDMDWIRTKLAHIGMNKDDIEIMVQAIQKRIVRDELSKEYGLFLDNYSWGLMTLKELQDFLGASNFTNDEIAYRLETADLVKGKVRLKLLRDAEIYLYRKDVNNEELFLTALQDLGIEIDIANAIVRNEAAKKGLEWEIPA